MSSHTSAGARGSPQERFEGDMRDVNQDFTCISEGDRHPRPGDGPDLSCAPIWLLRMGHPIARAQMPGTAVRYRLAADALLIALLHQGEFSLTMSIDIRRISA